MGINLKRDCKVGFIFLASMVVSTYVLASPCTEGGGFPMDYVIETTQAPVTVGNSVAICTMSAPSSKSVPVSLSYLRMPSSSISANVDFSDLDSQSTLKVVNNWMEPFKQYTVYPNKPLQVKFTYYSRNDYAAGPTYDVYDFCAAGLLQINCTIIKQNGYTKIPFSLS